MAARGGGAHERGTRCRIPAPYRRLLWTMHTYVVPQPGLRMDQDDIVVDLLARSPLYRMSSRSTSTVGVMYHPRAHSAARLRASHSHNHS